MTPDPSIVTNLKAGSGAADSKTALFSFSPRNEKLYFPTEVQCSTEEESWTEWEKTQWEGRDQGLCDSHLVFAGALEDKC